MEKCSYIFSSILLWSPITYCLLIKIGQAVLEEKTTFSIFRPIPTKIISGKYYTRVFHYRSMPSYDENMDLIGPGQQTHAYPAMSFENYIIKFLYQFYISLKFIVHFHSFTVHY